MLKYGTEKHGTLSTTMVGHGLCMLFLPSKFKFLRVQVTYRIATVSKPQGEVTNAFIAYKKFVG